MSHRSRRRFSAYSSVQTAPAPVESLHITNASSTSRWSALLLGLFYFLVLTVPFFFTWVNEELFEFNKMLLTYGVTVLILASWILRMIYEQRVIFRRTWFDLPIALFVISQILSTIFSIHPQTSFFGYYTRFHGGLLSILTYVTLYYAFVSNVEKKHLPNFFLALFAAALGVSFYAIPEHFGASPSCAMISGEWNVACWIQDVQNRVFATFGQPNWLAAYAVVLIPLGISVSLTPINSTYASRWRQLFFAFTTLLLFVTLLFTKSRSGFLGFGVSMVMYAGGFIWINRSTTNSRLTSFLTIAFKTLFFSFFALFTSFFVFLMLIFGTPFTPSLADLRNDPQLSPSSILEATPPPTNRLDVGGTDSGEIRKIVWVGALKVWQRYPLLGSGVETFAYSYYQDRPLAHNLVSEWDFLYNKAHNEFLNYLATTGVVGVLAYCLLVGAFIGGPLWKIFISHDAQTQKADLLLDLGLATGLIALTISNALGFSTVMVSILLFLYPALMTVIHDQGSWVMKHPSPATLETNETTQAMKIVSAIVVGIVSLTALTALMSFWRADKLFALGKQYNQAGQILTAIQYFTEALDLAPNEALYYDELSTTYSRAAVALAEQGEATQSAQVAHAAIQNSNKALELNSRHLNFYKTRARVFITLAQLDPELLQEAHTTLAAAIALSPTEAKLYYNRGIVEISMGQVDRGIATLEETVQMKTDYEAARFHLAQQYEAQRQPDKALEQYRYILDNINPNNETVKAALTQLEARN